MHTACRRKLPASHSATTFATVLLDQWPIHFQLDCRASCSVISTTLIMLDWRNICLEKYGQVLAMYNKIILSPVGKCSLLIRNSQSKWRGHLEFTADDIPEHQPLQDSRRVQAIDLITAESPQCPGSESGHSHCKPCSIFWWNITTYSKMDSSRPIWN